MSHPPVPGPEVHLTVLLPHVRNIINNWFDRWNNIVVPGMFKVSKWEVGHPDLQIRDYCLLHQKKGRHGLVGYKYCCVTELLESRVCTIKVKYYNSPSKKAKFLETYVRKLTLVPSINDPN